MNKRVIGYIVAGIGLLIFFLSYPTVRNLAGISVPESISDLSLTLIGIVLLLVGAFILYKSGSPKKQREIPIYEGHGKKRKIVGFQRVK